MGQICRFIEWKKKKKSLKLFGTSIVIACQGCNNVGDVNNT